MKISTVFFDLYGTLAGFKPSRYEVQSKACAELDIEVTPEGITRGYGLADAYMTTDNSSSPLRLRTPEGRERFFVEYERLILEGAGAEVTPGQAGEIWRHVRSIPHDLAPFDDVEPALGALKQRGLTVGLISNIDRQGPELAESLGLVSLLDVVVTSGEVGAEKPSPAIFEAALSRAEAKSDDTIHVGDQPTSDVDGALAVGITPVLLDRDRNHEGFDRCPRIETLAELPNLLDTRARTQ